jgi:hypothetical protein
MAPLLMVNSKFQPTTVKIGKCSMKFQENKTQSSK